MNAFKVVIAYSVYSTDETIEVSYTPVAVDLTDQEFMCVIHLKYAYLEVAPIGLTMPLLKLWRKEVLKRHYQIYCRKYTQEGFIGKNLVLNYVGKEKL